VYNTLLLFFFTYFNTFKYFFVYITNLVFKLYLYIFRYLYIYTITKTFVYMYMYLLYIYNTDHSPSMLDPLFSSIMQLFQIRFLEFLNNILLYRDDILKFLRFVVLYSVYHKDTKLYFSKKNSLFTESYLVDIFL